MEAFLWGAYPRSHFRMELAPTSPDGAGNPSPDGAGTSWPTCFLVLREGPSILRGGAQGTSSILRGVQGCVLGGVLTMSTRSRIYFWDLGSIFSECITENFSGCISGCISGCASGWSPTPSPDVSPDVSPDGAGNPSLDVSPDGVGNFSPDISPDVSPDVSPDGVAHVSSDVSSGCVQRGVWSRCAKVEFLF